MSTKTIMLAEDSPEDELLFRHVLRQAHVAMPLVVVHDGDETIAYLKGEGGYSDRDHFPLPDVLFLDLRMRRVDGWEVLKWIKAQPALCTIPVVVLTVFNETKAINRAYAMGAHSFLIKPFNLQDFRNLLRFFTHWGVTTDEKPNGTMNGGQGSQPSA